MARVAKIMQVLEAVSLWAGRAAIVMLVLAFVAMTLSPNGVAFAQGTGPTDEAAGKLVGIFTDLGKLVIKMCYALMFIVFAVGMVKAGLAAQAAQAFGATGRVSMEFLNMVSGVVVFVVGLMTLPIVNMVIDSVSAKFLAGGTDIIIHNPFVP